MNEPILSREREERLVPMKPMEAKRLTPEQLEIYKSIKEPKEASQFIKLIMEGENMKKLDKERILELAKKYGIGKEGRAKIAAEIGSTLGTVTWYISHYQIKKLLDKQEKEQSKKVEENAIAQEEKAPEISATAGKQGTDTQEPIEKPITANNNTAKDIQKEAVLNVADEMHEVKSIDITCVKKERSIKPSEILLKGKLMNWRLHEGKVSFKRPGKKSPSIILKDDEIGELMDELYEIKFNYLSGFGEIK